MSFVAEASRQLFSANSNDHSWFAVITVLTTCLLILKPVDVTQLMSYLLGQDEFKILQSEQYENCLVRSPVEQFPRKERTVNDRMFIYGNENPRQLLVLRNCKVLNGNGTLHDKQQDIFIRNGIIERIIESDHSLSDYGFSLNYGSNTEIVNVNGQYTTPGLINPYADTTQFAGSARVITDGELFFHDALDFFIPDDETISTVVTSGITLSMIFPHGKQSFGEAYALKMAKPPSGLVRDMLLQNNAAEAQRWLQLPCSNFPFRKMLTNAKILQVEQDFWCSVKHYKRSTLQYPNDFELEPLVAMLRKQAEVITHCSTLAGAETLLRYGRTIGFDISGFYGVSVPEKFAKALLHRSNDSMIASGAVDCGH